MFFSERMREELLPYSENANTKIPISVIVWGINSGNILGDQAELRELIVSNVVDPTEIAEDRTSRWGSPMSALLNIYSSRKPDVQNNIIHAFRVLFELNPTAILSSYLVEISDDQEWTPSAIERIGDFGLQEAFQQELLSFIRQNASACSETQFGKRF